jgi:hypothetical protein
VTETATPYRVNVSGSSARDVDADTGTEQVIMVRLPTELADELKQLSAERGETMAQIARRALIVELSRLHRELPRHQRIP